MIYPYEITNKSFLLSDTNRNEYEVWYLKLNPEKEPWSFWFRFTLLKNPSKSVAEVWGIFTYREKEHEGGRTYSTAIKNTFSLEQCIYKLEETPQITVGNNHINFMNSTGKLEKNGKKLYWDLNLTPIAPQESFNFTPLLLWKMGLVKNYTVTIHEKMLFNGFIETEKGVIPVQNAWGMQGHLAGLKQGHSWAWAHTCMFYEEDTGEPSPTIIDILTAKARIGKNLVTPKLTTMFIFHDEKVHRLNSIRNLLSIKSKYIPQYWELQTETEQLKINLIIESDVETIVGVQYEDTDESKLYCYNTKMATIHLSIKDKEKNIEKRYVSPNKGAFEWVQRDLWNKVPISI